MNEGRIATRYAKALLASLAADSKRGEAYYHAAERILPMLEGASEEIAAVLGNVLLSEEKKRSSIAAVFSRFAPELESYASFVVAKGRGAYLTHSLRVFLDLYRRKHGIVRADIITVVPLQEQQLKQLKDYLHKYYGESIEMATREDPSLIGGFQLQVGDNLLDRSVAGELKAIAAELQG